MSESEPFPRRETAQTLNVLAVLSLVCALLSCFPLGIVLGHVAKRQLRRNGQRGDLAASLGLALAYLYLAGMLVVAFLLLIGLVSAWLNDPAR